MRSEIMKNTSFKVEDNFRDVICKDNFSQEQITNFNIVLTKKNVNNNFIIR